MLKVDVLIVGGGVAGLWLLAALRARGINVLLATDVLGKGQTIASQGIIHGGTKYALSGAVSTATLAIGDMPRLWRAALRGEGAVDLSQVKVLADHQLLWTSGSIGARLTGFFASKTMHSRMQALAPADYPVPFQCSDFQGSLYRLDEPVLDVLSLLASLREQLADALLQVDAEASCLQPERNGYVYRAVLADGTSLTVAAQRIVLAAGAGNEALLMPLAMQAQPPLVLPRMQRRPLHMVLVRGDLPLLYAHALGMSDKPRATITSHRDATGRVVWYIGGQPAEQGVGKPAAPVIAATRAELTALLPWLNFKGKAWATWQVERAEGLQTDGRRPDQPVIEQYANLTVVWPTKLAFAPMVAARLQSLVNVAPSPPQPLPAADLPTPPLAMPVWDQAPFTLMD